MIHLRKLEDLKLQASKLTAQLDEVNGEIEAIQNLMNIVGGRIFASILYMEIFTPIKPLHEWTIDDVRDPELKNYLSELDHLHRKFSAIFPEATHLQVVEAYKLSLDIHGVEPEY